MALRSAKELAEYLSCAVEGDAEASVRGVAGPDRADEQDLVYLDSPRHLESVSASKARCVIVPSGLRINGKTLLIVDKPKLAFAKAAAWFEQPAKPAGLHSTAVVAQSASLGSGVSIGPFVVIEDDVTVGDGCSVGAHSFLGHGSRLGNNCLLHPRVTLYAGAHLGDRVIVHSGAVLGSDGFGYVTDHGRHLKFPQVGALEIADDAEIGANTTIDRGSLGTTTVGTQAKIDNLVHIAHNVEIGDRTLIAAQTGIAGSSVVGKDVLLGGQVGIGDHCRLEDGAIAGGQAGILNGKILRRGEVVWGTPARPLSRFKEQYVWLAKLPELAQRLTALEKAVAGHGAG
jgi:UDP-3-O-[3-hydroxymyristoyl] glucosamine N-acyltransferase